MSTAIQINNTLEKIISTIGDLPASPAIVSSVMGLTSDLNSKITDITQVLMSDQSLTAKVLKLSNSSFYGRPKEVGTLEEAIPILGFFTVRSMVIATSAHTMYSKGNNEESSQKLWQHSLATAVSARSIANKLNFPNKDEVFIAALLHDIGKLVLIQNLGDRYQELIDEIEEGQLRFRDVELKELSFSHCQISTLLLNKWSFPVSLIDAVESHHADIDLDDDSPITTGHIVQLANHIGKRENIGFNDYIDTDISELSVAHKLGVDKEWCDELIPEITEHYTIEARIFEES